MIGTIRQMISGVDVALRSACNPPTYIPYTLPWGGFRAPGATDRKITRVVREGGTKMPHNNIPIILHAESTQTHVGHRQNSKFPFERS